MATKTANPHAWFYAHLKTVEGWGQGYDEVIKEGVVSAYSDGMTTSLKQLYERYPKLYNRMRSELSNRTKTKRAEQDPRLDKARKKLIAAIFSHLEDKGYIPDMDYVKRVACNGAKVTRFNDIPLNTLKNLYNQFVNKDLQAGVNELIKNTGLCLSKK